MLSQTANKPVSSEQQSQGFDDGCFTAVVRANKNRKVIKKNFSFSDPSKTSDV